MKYLCTKGNTDFCIFELSFCSYLVISLLVVLAYTSWRNSLDIIMPFDNHQEYGSMRQEF